MIISINYIILLEVLTLLVIMIQSIALYKRKRKGILTPYNYAFYAVKHSRINLCLHYCILFKNNGVLSLISTFNKNTEVNIPYSSIQEISKATIISSFLFKVCIKIHNSDDITIITVGNPEGELLKITQTEEY